MNNFLNTFIFKYIKKIKNSSPQKLLKTIAAIEYVEGIFEISATKLFGEKFKWLIIFVTQLTKCILRLCLLLFHKIGIQSSPKLFTMKSFLGKNDKNAIKNNELSVKQNAFKLKHTGRVVRSIDNAPELNERTWKLDKELIDECVEDFDPTSDSQYLLAELVYITRPICHLVCIYLFNAKSWIQFLVPFIMDATNLILISDAKKLSKKQKQEMKRRTYLFLVYLLRSPVYDLYSSSIIEVILNIFERKLPAGKYLIKPIKNYIPEWRSVYSYCWAS